MKGDVDEIRLDFDEEEKTKLKEPEIKLREPREID